MYAYTYALILHAWLKVDTLLHYATLPTSIRFASA